MQLSCVTAVTDRLLQPLERKAADDRIDGDAYVARDQRRGTAHGNKETYEVLPAGAVALPCL